MKTGNLTQSGISAYDRGVASINNVAGSNIDLKTINNESLIGPGNIILSTAGSLTPGDNITIEGGTINAIVPENTSDLVNDSNFIADSNYVHTDNNYTTEEKSKLAGLSNYDDSNIVNAIDEKQDILIAGANITIDPDTNTISSTGGSEEIFIGDTEPSQEEIKLWIEPESMGINIVTSEELQTFSSKYLVKRYSTLENLKNDTGLKSGDVVETLGFYKINDDGGAKYAITDIEDSSRYQELLSNNLYANLIVCNNNFNVNSIGLKGDGETNNSEILYNFLKIYIEDNITLSFQNGEYLFEKRDDYIYLPSKTQLLGNGTSIMFNDTEEVGVSLFNGAAEELIIKKINFKSTFNVINSLNNPALLYYNQSDERNDVIIEDCEFKDFRTNVFENKNTNSLYINNCKYINIGRDSNRFLNCFKSIVSNSYFYLCGDDVVSTHGDIKNSTHLFKNNYIELSFGPAYLGGKNIVISNNNYVNPILTFKCGMDRTEGGSTNIVKFIDNYVQQPIKIVGITDDRTQWLGSGTEKIYINNNIFIDEDISSISEINVVGVKYFNQTISKGLYVVSSIDSTYQHQYLQFNDNFCDIMNGPSSLDLGDTRLILGDFEMIDMNRNKIENFYSHFTIESQTKNNWNIEDNYFNGDKKHLLTTDGVFSSSTSLRVFITYPLNFKNNICRNISGNYGMNRKNIILYQPDGKFMNPININVESEFIPYDEDTGLYLNIPLNKTNGIPTEGYYHQGSYIYCNYAGDNNPIAYYRLSTGNTHVANVDWEPIYAKTSI